jgi:3-oxoacyl-[acyl-carrier protein] reductase
VVTGAARGIGKASSLALAREGADVAALDILLPEETAAEVKRLGRTVLPLVCNIEDPQAIRAMVGRVFQEFGRVDFLVNNAAILGASEKSFEDYAPEEWDLVFRVNVRGPALLTQAIWPHMVNQGGGKIVCIGSIAGRMGGLRAGPHYTASKGAIHAFVKWAAKKGAPFRIYVNGIAPGPVDTPMIANQGYTAEGIPLGRLGQPEDIAMAVVFLASQASNFITGQILDVNGGILMA